MGVPPTREPDCGRGGRLSLTGVPPSPVEPGINLCLASPPLLVWPPTDGKQPVVGGYAFLRNLIYLQEYI